MSSQTVDEESRQSQRRRRQIPRSLVPARRIRYGSDCSGYDAAAIALKYLRVPHQHCFASEKNSRYRRVLAATHEIDRIDVDITTRSFDSLPHVDIYTAGFPCTPFSGMGTRDGPDAADGSGLLGLFIVMTIRFVRPAGFILENVPALITVYLEFFYELLRELASLGYELHWKVLNSKNHGVAASRLRLYLVGIRKDLKRGRWGWPASVAPVPLTSILDSNHRRRSLNQLNMTNLRNLCNGIEKIKAKHPDANVDEEPWVIDLQSSQAYGTQVKYNQLPCITRARAQQGFWVTKLHDFTNVSELLKAQGVRQLQDVKRGSVPENALRQMVGNSFTVTVFERLWARLLPIIGCGNPVDRFSLATDFED